MHAHDVPNNTTAGREVPISTKLLAVVKKQRLHRLFSWEDIESAQKKN